jgi:hypothetical protein
MAERLSADADHIVLSVDKRMRGYAYDMHYASGISSGTCR